MVNNSVLKSYFVDEVPYFLFVCLSFRGTSSSNGFSAFRECYGRLHELRSLVPTVKVIALTATATLKTLEVIEDILFMDDPAVVYECPSKPNISYSVCYMKNDALLDDYFIW